MKLWPVFLLVLTLVRCCSLVSSVGHKQRLKQLQAEQTVDDHEETLPTKHGRHKQRRVEAEQTAATSSSSSSNSANTLPFNNDLVNDWASGKLISKQVQRCARHALEQGASGLFDFAKMGNSGENPQNIFRAMRSMLGLPKGAPEMDWYEIPTVKNNRTPHPFLIPHRFFSAFFTGRSNADWAKHMAGAKNACWEFWNSMKDTDFVTHHPNLPEHSWRYTIPCGFHADAGSFSHQDSIYVFSFNSLVGRGSTHQKRFIFTVLRKSEMLGNTMDEVLRIFAWSCNVLLGGETPHVGPFGRAVEGGGQPLAGPWRASLCQVRGDWAFYKECFNFPQWNAAVSMCFCCRASSTIRALSWTNFSPLAGWRDTIWTHEAYLAHLYAEGLPVPILLALAIGLRLESIMVDVLHTIDLGIAAHIVGNIMFIYGALRGVFGGGTFKERVSELSKVLSAWYKRTKCPSRLQGSLTLERIRAKGDWPKLKAKAAAVRHLARFVLWVVEEHGDGSPYDALVLNVAGLLVAFYDILESESQFLSAAAKENLPKIGQKLADSYARLAKLSFDSGNRLWKLSPKLHLAEHLMEWQAVLYGNPRWYWTYADEDLVGMMADIAEACHPSTLPFSVLFKWLHSTFSND